ncbi:MAG: hypothetical protein ACHQYQ_09170, partial [Bacteriovoracales bacterium]
KFKLSMKKFFLGFWILTNTIAFTAGPDLQTDKIPDCGEKQIEFKDYPASGTFDGKSRMLNLDSVKKKDLRNFLGLKPRKIKSPNFAKFFRIIKGGCGTMCTTYVAIDCRDGEPYPLGIAATLGIRYRKDSSLIIMESEEDLKKLNNELKEQYLVDKTTYFYWKDNKLTPICTRKFTQGGLSK